MALPARCSRRAFSSPRPPFVFTRPLVCQRRQAYHSYDYAQPPPYNEPENSILSAALSHVPTQGFTSTALQLGARDAGYLDVSTNLFPRGAFDLIIYHLVTRRLALKDTVQFPSDEAVQAGAKKTGVGAKVRTLTLERLRASKPTIHQWQGALATMAQPSYIPASLRELAALSDEIWFLAGDTSVDTSWYTKRATLSAIYSATDVFMAQDQSTDFKDTERFLDARLEDSRIVGTAVGSVGEWLEYTAHSFVNLARSKGVRI